MIRSKIIIKATFFFLLSFSFFLVSCSSPTSTPKGNLTGVVHLEGLSDHSDIIVALYDLATLDPEIVSINSQYPHIGVIINQHTEFDHRLQSPVKYTETDAEGYFEIKKIPTGTYNIVALKDSFGFKYIYEFEIEKNDNQLTLTHPSVPSLKKEGKVKGLTPPLSYEKRENNPRLSEEFSQRYPAKSPYRTEADLTLYPETTYSGVITENLTFETDHHYIIDDDTDVLSNYSLTIQPGAVIRIEPGKDFTILGTLSTQGEENNMFWVTSNDGFSNVILSLSKGELAIYNSFELSSIATVSDDLIEWGKFDFANTCLMNQVNNLHIQNGIFRDSWCGFKSTNVDSTFCEKLFTENCSGINESGIYFENIFNGLVENNIFYNCFNGNKIKGNFRGNILNNYFYLNSNGIELWDMLGYISHNEFNSLINDIKITGFIDIQSENTYITLNNLNGLTGLYQFENATYIYYSLIILMNNNFFNEQLFILHNSGYCISTNYYYINADDNYFGGLTNIEDVMQKIIQQHPDCENRVLINSISSNIIYNAGIQED